jgi:hypothetical protein
VKGGIHGLSQLEQSNRKNVHLDKEKEEMNIKREEKPHAMKAWGPI